MFDQKIDIIFDPTLHRYTDSFGNEYTSVTTLIGEVEKPFDKEYWSMYKALEKSGYSVRPYFKGNSFYINNIPYTIQALKLGVLPLPYTQDMILDDWARINREACIRGNKKHDYLESCINKFSPGDTKRWDTLRNTPKDFLLEITDKKALDKSPLKFTDPKVYKVLIYLLDRGYVLFAEKRVYSFYYLVAGTIDVFAYNPTTKEFVIVDWKTNKKQMHFNSGYYKKVWIINDKGEREKVESNEWVTTEEKFLSPLQHLDVCKGNLYGMQLSIYAYLCELQGFIFKRLALVHFRDDVPVTIYNNLPYLRDEAYTLLEWKIRETKKYRKPIY